MAIQASERLAVALAELEYLRIELAREGFDTLSLIEVEEVLRELAEELESEQCLHRKETV